MGTTATLPAITNREQDLLRLIYKFRFLNRSQIQTLMGHKDKRLINVWLKDLCQKSYLGQKYSNKFPENTKPAIYFTHLKAIRYFKEQDKPESVIQRLYRDRNRTRDFISSKLLLADIAIELQHDSDDDIRFDLATSSDYANPQSIAYFLTMFIFSPDAVFTRLDRKAKQTRSFIVEIFPRNYPSNLQYAKMGFYLNLYEFKDWEKHTKLSSPELVLIFFSYGQLLAAKRYLKRVLDKAYDREVDDLRAKFILASSVHKSGFIEAFDATSYA